MNAKFRRFRTFLVAGLVAAVPAAASAEIVHLTSGRTMNVAGHRFEGELAILSLRSGGEMSMPRDLISRIADDEVPWVPPAPRVPRSTGSVPVSRVAADPEPQALAPAHVEALIAKAAEAHDVDPNLVRAVIRVESAYKARAKSRKGAMGLMQLMPATAREYGVRNAYDPAENIDAGVKHLRSLLDEFDVPLALAAYNAGQGTVRKYGGIPPYKETRNYVRKILTLAGLQ